MPHFLFCPEHDPFLILGHNSLTNSDIKIIQFYHSPMLIPSLSICESVLLIGWAGNCPFMAMHGLVNPTMAWLNPEVQVKPWSHLINKFMIVFSGVKDPKLGSLVVWSRH